jgi:hypothetical protein
MFDDPIARASYMATAQIAPSIGGLFGVQNQAQSQAAKIQEIASQVPLNEQADPHAYYTDLARRLINSGLTQAGNEALGMAAKTKPAAVKPKELSTEAYKEVMKATANARTAGSNVTKANSLMTRYNQVDPESGILARGWSKLKSIFGSQGQTETLKADFDALVNSAVIENLPPGPATDKDIEIIQKGFPNSSWNTMEIERWLEAYRDAAEFQQFYERERAKYMSANNGLDVGFDEAIREDAKRVREAQVARREAAAAKAKEQTEQTQTPPPPVQFDPAKVPGAAITTSPSSGVNATGSVPGVSPGTMTVPSAAGAPTFIPQPTMSMDRPKTRGGVRQRNR